MVTPRHYSQTEQFKMIKEAGICKEDALKIAKLTSLMPFQMLSELATVINKISTGKIVKSKSVEYAERIAPGKVYFITDNEEGYEIARIIEQSTTAFKNKIKGE